jgi:hypothetical protein
MESRSNTVFQAANNELLVGITIPREQLKKYSGINGTVHIRSGSD